MTKTIVITSGKGGVGKTNISVNTALELSNRGCRTCLFDADFGLANVDIILGLHPEKTLNDVICGDKNLGDIILHSEAGIDVIPGSSGIEKIANLTSEEISKLVSAFSQLTGYDYFLIDTSSGISKSVISFCLAGTETFVVITSEATSLIDAYSLIKVMAANSYQGTIKILVNKCPDVPTSKRTYARFKKAVDTYLKIKISFAGIVLLDPYIEKALKSQEPVLSRFPDSVASQCIRSVVSILLSNTSLNESSGDFGDFWKRFFDFTTTDLSIPKDFPGNSKQSSTQSAVSIDKPRKSLDSVCNSVSGMINEDLPLDTSPLSNDASPKNIVKQPPQPDIGKDMDSESTNLSKEIHHKEVESKEPPILSRDRDIPTAFSQTVPEITNLPTPLPILAKYLELKAKGALSQKELIEIFTCDPALMVRILKISGTSKQRRGQRLTNIHQTLQKVDTELLSNTLTEISLQRAFNDQSTLDTSFVNQFWYHSYKAALIAQHIASTVEYPYSDEAFLAGLIHDIARLTLQTHYPELYKQFPGSFYNEEQLVNAETKAFGRDHAEIGAASLHDWQLNSFISDAVKYHTESEATIETAFDLVKIVYVACKLADLTPEKSTMSMNLAKSLLKISTEQIQNCISRSNEKIEQTAAYYEIPLSSELDAKSLHQAQVNFRQLALDYSLVQGVLPSPVANRSLTQIVIRIHQGLSILFNIQKSICLLKDKQSSCLQAVGYLDCWAEEILSDISFSLQSAHSAILDAFSSRTVIHISENDPPTNLSLGDKQLLNYFDSSVLVCVPMVESGKSIGVIILGCQEDELTKFKKFQDKLEQFGAQAAKYIKAIERNVGFGETRPTLPSSSQMRDVKSVILG